MSEDLEESNELALELAAESARDEHKEPWVNHAAFSSMIIAMIMTVGALLSGISVNEAMIERQNEIVTQSKFNLTVLKNEILQNRLQIQEAEGVHTLEPLEEQIESLEELAVEYSIETVNELHQSEATLHVHEMLAVGVTIMSIGVTMTGMSIVLRKKAIWYTSLIFAGLGMTFVFRGFYSYFS
ncbi:DUF4337 family protein [bacterium]|nr:DUF4337 family protein [bacterium]